MKNKLVYPILVVLLLLFASCEKTKINENSDPLIKAWMFSKVLYDNIDATNDYEGRYMDFYTNGTYNNYWGESDHMLDWELNEDKTILTLDVNDPWQVIELTHNKLSLKQNRVTYDMLYNEINYTVSYELIPKQ